MYPSESTVVYLSRYSRLDTLIYHEVSAEMQ